MASSRIKGITIEIGGDVTGLNKALQSTNKQIRDTQSQLKDVEKLLKLDPTNTELLAQKQRLLSQQVEQTTDKLKTLRNAEKQVQQQFAEGKVSREQYEGLQREIAATEIALGGAEKAAYDLQESLMQSVSDKALKDFEDAAKDLNNALEKVDEKPIEDVSDAADKAEAELKDVADAADDVQDSAKRIDFGDVLSANVIADGVGQVVDAVGELRDEVTDYQRIMASLEVSSQNAGYSASQTAAGYRELYGVLGDEQTAATTLSNLQALELGQDQLNQVIDGAIGAWATYGDSIPIDGLAEAINETIRTGTVTGTFADVLNWAGTSEDAFNDKLAAANDESERANLVLQELADQGLTAAGQAWQDQNADLVAANQAQADFMENAAQMSERLAPIYTSVQEGLNAIFEKLLEMTSDVDFKAIADAISDGFGFVVENADTIVQDLGLIGAGIAAMKMAQLGTDISSVISGAANLTTVFPQLGGVVAAFSNPVTAVIAAITALIVIVNTFGDQTQAVLGQVDEFLQGVFATDWTESFGIFGNVINAFFANAKNVWDSFTNILNGVIDFIRGIFTGNWERVWKGVVELLQGIWGGVTNIVKAPINGIIGLMNGLIDGINTVIDGINSISFTNPFTGETVGFSFNHFGKIPYLAQGGIVYSGSAIVGEAGPELLTVSPGRTVVQPLPSSGGYNGSVGGAAPGVTAQQVQSAAQMIVAAIEANNGPIIIGDEMIGRANARYQADRNIMMGGAF